MLRNVFERGPVTATAYELRSRNDRGQQVESAGITITVITDAQVIRMEQFTSEQLDDALRTAEQLARELSTDRRHVLSNNATRFVELVMSDRSTGADIAGRFEAATLAANPVTLARAASDGRPTTCRPIAIRGERFALHHAAVDDGDGSTLERLTVCALDESGVCWRWIDFEPEQLAEAQDELDRLWLDSLPDEERAFRRLNCETNKALGRLDLQFLERVLSDDLVCIDHKPLGWGRRTKEQFIDSQRARRGTTGPGVFLTPEYVFEQGPVAAGRYEFRTLNDRGQQVETAGISVGAIDGGQIVRMEVFPPDQLDDLLRTAEQLARGFPRTG